MSYFSRKTDRGISVAGRLLRRQGDGEFLFKAYAKTGVAFDGSGPRLLHCPSSRRRLSRWQWTPYVPNEAIGAVAHRDCLVCFFVNACRDLRVFYAVSGFSLFFYSYASGATAKAYPHFRRFPGLFYEDVARFGLAIRDRTDTIRDVKWLTAVNDELLERVGGIDKARTLLAEEAILHPYEGGVVFQAGEQPVLGDLNKGCVPAAYRAINDFLKPLRYENWERLS